MTESGSCGPLDRTSDGLSGLCVPLLFLLRGTLDVQRHFYFSLSDVPAHGTAVTTGGTDRPMTLTVGVSLSLFLSQHPLIKKKKKPKLNKNLKVSKDLYTESHPFLRKNFVYFISFSSFLQTRKVTTTPPPINRTPKGRGGVIKYMKHFITVYETQYMKPFTVYETLLR